MSVASVSILILIGVAAGILSGMVGIGGGIVIVPLLVMAMGLSQQTAQGTTLAMLSFPVSFVAAYQYWQKGMVDWKIALILCLGFMVGGFIGGRFAVSIQPLLLKRIFAVLMIVIAFKFLVIDKS